jgi:hypothetical protein
MCSMELICSGEIRSDAAKKALGVRMRLILACVVVERDERGGGQINRQEKVCRFRRGENGGDPRRANKVRLGSPR